MNRPSTESRLAVLPLFLLVALTSACGTSARLVVPRNEVFDKPSPGSTQLAERGATILEKGDLHIYDGIVLKNEVTGGDGFFTNKFRIPPQKLRAAWENDESVFYVGDKVSSYNPLLGNWAVSGGLRVSKNDPEDISIWGRNLNIDLDPEPKPRIRPTKFHARNRPGFRQELIYGGRVGDTLNFVYREFTTGLGRAPFTQKFQHTLTENRVVRFRGIRVEVLNATNDSIQYRVVRSFPDEAVRLTAAGPPSRP